MDATEYPTDPISPRDAARLLGVHISAVYRWLDRGRLPFWSLPSGHKRLSRADVLALPKPGKPCRPVAFAVLSQRQQSEQLKRDVETLKACGAMQ